MQTKLTCVLLILSGGLSAQNGIDSVLSSVAQNNKTIQSASQYYESQALVYRTGNTPTDPSVGFDYMKGSPVTAGNQIDFTVTQSFDFPTVYGDKKDLVESQTALSEYQMQALRQNILLETHLVCLQLIYLNKLHSNLTVRVQHAERIFNDYTAKIDQGGATILELNKAKINLFNLQNELRINEGEINGWNQKLTQLNGGIPVEFKDTLYPLTAQLPAFEELELLYEQADPNLKNLEQQLVVTQQQLDLSQSLWLPKFETGYHYQAILGQTFSGIHFGMTIPLWQNHNTIDQKEAEVTYNESLIDEHRTAHYFALKQLYENYIALRTSYEQYQELIGSLTSVALLEKALNAGELTVIEFFMELGSYYVTYDNLLKIEKEYYSVVAALNKYLL